MRNPSKPLPKSDEAKRIVQENKREEKISTERKMLLQRKKKKAVEAAMARTEEGEEAEEEDPCFPEQSMETDPKLNHPERGVQVTCEGKDNWGEPYWHDRWHPQAHQPGNILDACPFSYVDVSDEMALSDLHMKNSDDLEAKNVFTRNDYNITLFSDRGLGHAQLVVY